MNRTDLVRATAEELELPITTVDTVVMTFFDFIREELAAGENVNIREFGQWVPRTRRAIVKKNPRTQKSMRIPRKHTVGFVPSVTLKRFLNT